MNSFVYFVIESKNISTKRQQLIEKTGWKQFEIKFKLKHFKNNSKAFQVFRSYKYCIWLFVDQ